ncbi:MAG: Polysaccharide deacetylase family protein [Microgenomates group bacterium GW2011_GWC1_37_8]|uniref:Polysaccharide deacetylase family protein n=2 Tax=Parcubacteria group TaxID=1794811 RepID=A0A0G1NAI5_9BACT|nr:MAG: Polysaccharide deacetylase family protein [Microgenomates group bacterium GW2011_GWC1_37_8]KKT81199.1 MAG: Polysaccharide deacetylase family protein [Candidatus Azambacteria bacterium GW2011_GWA1_44_9]OHA90522.1 MAG: hypothetical protein A2838_00915 [Candidatus Zambryskibacteria bacterium RIFCSPHIGHO2_01_FULL_46_25]
MFRYLKSLPRVLYIYLKDKLILKKRVAILMYHSVSDDNNEFFTVSSKNFMSQMNYLYENNYVILSLHDLIEYINSKKKIPKKSVVLTLDDGYEDNYLTVFPMLKKYNFPATIFLITGLVGNKNYSNRGIKLPMLDWGQIQEMHSSGLIDFQPHTVSHPRLSISLPNEVIYEMEDSKKEIERRLGKKCTLFAYPKGDYNISTIEIAGRIFDGAVTTDMGFTNFRSSLLSLRRNSVHSQTDSLTFKLKI